MKIADLEIKSTIFIDTNHKFDIKTYNTIWAYQINILNSILKIIKLFSL